MGKEINKKECQHNYNQLALMLKDDAIIGVFYCTKCLQLVKQAYEKNIFDKQELEILLELETEIET